MEMKKNSDTPLVRCPAAQSYTSFRICLDSHWSYVAQAILPVLLKL
jgi:hypothetical protein